jgi:hypothetical protein
MIATHLGSCSGANPMTNFIWPSDQDRADNDELNRVCEHLEAVMGERDALAADRAALLKELVPCQNVLHQLARSGQCTPAYADDAKQVLSRVTCGNPPTFDDRSPNGASLARRDALKKAEALEEFLEGEYGGNLDFDAVFKIEQRATNLRRQAEGGA